MATTARLSTLKRVTTGRRLRFLAVVMSAFALLFTAVPQVAQAAGNVAVADGSGVEGTVGLADAGPGYVTIVAFRITDGTEDWYDSVSVPSGHWELPDLVAGQYVLRFSSGGYRSQCFGGDPCAAVDVVDGSVAILDPVTLVRTTPGTVKGTVLDGSAKPIPGALVHATYEDQQVDAQTDAAGAWELTELSSEVSWQVSITKPGTTDYSGWIYPKEGRTVSAGVVMLVHPGSVSGTVRDSSGTGIADALVYLRPTDGTPSTSVMTGAGGTYSFATVSPGRYLIFVRADEHPDTYYPQVASAEDAKVVAVTEGRVVTGADVTAPTGATISGHLRDGSGDLSGGAHLYERGSGFASFAWAPEGAYRFTDLWPGKYTVEAQADGHRDTWLGDTASEQDAVWLAMASGGQSLENDITLPVRPTYLAAGTVQSAAGSVAQLTVRLGDVETLTDADGHFSMALDHAGNYPVQVGVGVGLVCGGEALACPTATVAVPAAGAENLVITIPALGSLGGDVLVPEGAITDGGLLTMTDASGAVLASYEFGGELDYFLLGLPYGDYTLRLVVDGLAPLRQTVTIDGAVTHDIELSSGFSVSGTITFAQSETWLSVVAVDSAGEEAASAGIDIAGGAGTATYQLGHLNPGDYTVGVQTSSGRWAWYPGGSDARQASPVTITAADRAGIDFALPAVADIYAVTGQFRLPAGIAASRAPDLTAWFEREGTGEEYYPHVRADGTYRVDLPKGSYRVRVDSSADLWTAPLAEDLEVTGPTAHDLEVVRGGSITGRLADPDGLGVAATVWATAGGTRLGSAVPNTWGYWTLGPLAAGTVTLHAAADGFVAPAVRTVTVVAGEVTEAGVLPFAGAGRLAVRIPSLGDDVSVKVVVTDLAGTKLASKGIWAGESGRIDGIPAGPVLVRFESDRTPTEWWQDAATRTEATPVTIAAGETAGAIVPRLALTAPPANGTLGGTVTNHTGLTGPMRVLATGPAGRQSVAVKPDGSYAVQLPPGRYQVKAMLCAGYWMGDSGCLGDTIALWYPGTDAAYARWVTVASEKTTGTVNIDLGGPLAFRSAAKPTISGSATVGGTLTAAAGTWSPVPSTLAYQWLRDGVVISGATAATHTVEPADGGAAVSVRVAGVKAGYATTEATSASVSIPWLHLTATPVPTVTGTAKLGSTLTAVPGTWGPGTVALAYQWLRGGVAIGGANGPGHLVVGADAGTSLSVRVTGSAPGYEPVQRTSAVTAKVPSGRMTTKTPTISGRALVGKALTAKVSGWRPSESTFTYVWYRSGKVIKGATAGTYTPVAADVGKTIKVKVTGTAVGYPSAAKTSKSTKKVAKGTIVAGKTVITGTAQVGQQLAIDTADWLPTGLKLTYQWYRSGRAISKAKAALYTVTSADLGKKLTVKVTASLSGYNTASKTSKATAPVVA